MENVQLFTNEEFGNVRIMVVKDEPYFVGKDVAKILGYQNASKALSDHVDDEDKLNNESLSSLGQRGGWLINESGLYSMILSSKLPSAKKFKRWITSEVLPTIRKTGGYVANEDLFVNTYLPFADEQTKLLFSTTLKTINEQNQLIKQQKETIEIQKEEIDYKQDIINGLTDDIDIFTKRNIINRICRRKHEDYANRYIELYKSFKETFHIDLKARCEGYNLNQKRTKDKLSVVGYAEKFGFIDDLYSCCAKLYEAEVRAILEELGKVCA